MVQMAQAVAETIAPAVAGALLGTLMIHGVMAVDLATFCVALVTLLLVRVPAVAREVAPEGERTSLLSEVAYGWRYIRERRGLFALLALFAVLSFTTGITAVLYTPLMLGLTTPAVLGLVTSIAGLGLLASSLLMSTWGGPRRRIVGVFAAEIVLGVAVMAMGLSVNPVVLGASLFLAYLTIPVVNACSQAIWQVKTAPEVQGRVFSFRRVIAGAMTPLAFVLAGPLADGVFNPLLAEGGAWASGIGQLVGVGAGRGIGALNLILGIITIAATLVAMAYRPLRQVESDLPDALPAPAAGSAEEEAPPPVGGAALATD